jgi:predicted dehydrogenase
MAPLRTAVIGCGYFGSHHARKYAALDGADLIAVCDADEAKARALAEELGTSAETDYRNLLDKVDAVSIATPTALHAEVATGFIKAGVHVLVEKPLCASLEEADALVAAAEQAGVVLQVGHLERFNPAVTALDGLIDKPGFVECERISQFRARGTDVNVVLDMMIHDIDLVLTLVGSPIDWIDAVGVPVLSEADDIASARIRFQNGCVASFTASRVSWKTHRLLRVFQPDAYLVADLNHSKVSIIRRTADDEGRASLDQSEQQFENGDPLMLEVASFLETVASGAEPRVSGRDGRAALDAALRITQQMADWGAKQRAARGV